MIRSKRFFSALVLLALFSFTPKEVPFSPKEQVYFLKNGIDRILYTLDPDLNVGVEVVSLKNGQKLYEKNVNRLFVPASAQKMFTAAAALQILGSDFRFETGLYSSGPIDEGTLIGDLYIKGSGDPSFCYDDLEKMVLELRKRGIRTVAGDIVYDNSAFDDEVQGPGWMWDEGADFWNSHLNALTINHGSIDLWIKPKKVGEMPELICYPETSYVKIENLAMTTEEENDLCVERRWKTKDNLIQITGGISRKSPAECFQIAIEDPAFYTATLLQELLKKHRIQVTGKIVKKETPTFAEILVCHISQPLSLLIQPMLQTSDNLYSNAFFKKIGEKESGSPGTWKKGEKALSRFLAENVGLDVSAMLLVDGDGESRYNLVSPHQFVTFLIWMYKHAPFFSEFLAALPVSGESGTLQERMKEIRGKIQAKSGTMRGISSLAGYATTCDGEELAFAIEMNGFVGPAREYKTQLEDALCSLLANFSRSDP